MNINRTPQTAAQIGQRPSAANAPAASEEQQQTPAACGSTTTRRNIRTPKERAHRTLSWEKLHDVLGIKLIPSLDDLKRSATKTQFVEDPEFATMDSDARIRAYWADFREYYRREVCSECGINDRELRLLDDLMGCWRSGPFGFASTTDLAARLNAKRAKEASLVASEADVIGGISPEEIGMLLERLFMQVGGRDWCQVDSNEIDRKLVQQTDASGQPVLVHLYRFHDNYKWDYLELEEFEIELIDRLIEMGVIVRTSQGHWIHKHTEKELLEKVRR